MARRSGRGLSCQALSHFGSPPFPRTSQTVRELLDLARLDAADLDHDNTQLVADVVDHRRSESDGGAEMQPQKVAKPDAKSLYCATIQPKLGANRNRRFGILPSQSHSTRPRCDRPCRRAAPASSGSSGSRPAGPVAPDTQDQQSFCPPHLLQTDGPLAGINNRSDDPFGNGSRLIIPSPGMTGSSVRRISIARSRSTWPPWPATGRGGSVVNCVRLAISD